MNSLTYHTHDPRTGEIAASFSSATDAEIDSACKSAKRAMQQWAATSPAARSQALAAIAALMREHREELVQLECRDTGKPIEAATGEVEGAIALWDYAASLARTETAHAFPASIGAGVAFTINVPVGVVGLIVPWNYPLITTSERLPFALAAGCSVICKPSELAAGSLPMLVERIAASGLLPAGTLQLLYGTGEAIGHALCVHPDIDMIGFVGSTRVGRLIESAATAHGKRVASELGGNNFVLVYEDADLVAAAKAVIRGGLRNGGQACVAGSHVLVAPAVAKDFVGLLQRELASEFPTDEQGRCPAVQPMITARHRARIAALVEGGVREGLRVLQGSCLEGTGNFIGPVIFSDVPLNSSLLAEETFGPVITVSAVEEAHFFDAPNASGYGLAAYVWTASTARAIAAAKALRAGRIWINSNPDFWAPELPVGGFGRSGTGREMGPQALATWSLPKSVLLS